MATLLSQYALCASLLAVAASSDVATRRVPNQIVVLVAIVGMVALANREGPPAITGGILAALIVGVPLGFAWRRGIVGGGDVKLAVAAALAVGLDRLSAYVIASALFGGALSLVIAFTAGRAAIGLPRVASAHREVASPVEVPATSASSVPYGVAIAAGALYALLSGGSR